MNDDNEAPMSTWDWFWTLLLMMIPLIGFIMVIVWACGVGNVNRVTFCRAGLLWCVAGLCIYVIFAAAIMHVIMSMAR
jgi:hypothetical protein